jgi:hypothetical protein
MPAQQHGFGLFGENLAFDVAADQKDSDLLGDSAASAHTFGGHSFTHSERTLFLWYFGKFISVTDFVGK